MLSFQPDNNTKMLHVFITDEIIEREYVTDRKISLQHFFPKTLEKHRLTPSPNFLTYILDANVHTWHAAPQKWNGSKCN